MAYPCNSIQAGISHSVIEGPLAAFALAAMKAVAELALEEPETLRRLSGNTLVALVGTGIVSGGLTPTECEDLVKGVAA